MSQVTVAGSPRGGREAGTGAVLAGAGRAAGSLPPIPRYLGYRCWVLLAWVALASWLCMPSPLKLGYRLVESGEPDKAVTLLERALASEIDPAARSEIQEELSKVELLLGRAGKALDYQEASVASAPDSIKARVRLAELHELFCRPRRAMEELAEAVEKYRNWDQHRPDILDLSRGLRVLAPSDLPSKERLKQRFREWFAPHRRRLAWYQRWFQELDGALRTHQDIVADDPGDFETWFHLATLHGYARDLEGAQRALETASRLRPEQRYLKDLLSQHYMWSRQPEKVLETTTRAELDRDETRRRVFRAYVQAGRAEEGFEDYLHRHPEDQDFRGLWFTLVDVLQEELDHVGAKRVLERYLGRAGNDEEGLERLGELQMVTREYPAAVKTYTRLLELHPRSRPHHQWLIDALDASGDPYLALARIEDLRDQDPGDVSLTRELAVRYAQLGMFDAASPHLETVHRERPDDRTIMYHLAQSLGVKGEVERSARLYEELLELMGPGVGPALPEPPAPEEVPWPRPGAPGPGPVARRVLAFHKRTEGETADRNRTHLWLELALNHLGLVVDHRAAEDPLPGEAEMAAYRGIITWFHTDRMPEAERFARWLAAQPWQGRPIVVLERFGCTYDSRRETSVSPRVLEELHRSLGLRFGGASTENPGQIEVREVDSGMCEFERPLAFETGLFLEIESLDPENEVFLRLGHREHPAAKGDAVVVGPGGAFCLATYVIHEDQDQFRRQWRIDPFRLFEKAFRLEGLPRPDVSTRQGTRLAYIHVDGDGSDASCRWDLPKNCAMAFLEHVLGKRNLPMTVSFIGSLVDPDLFVGDLPVRNARAIFEAPEVEPAHHTWSHPLDWRTDDPGLKIPGYEVVDLDREVRGARELLQQAACPPGKTVRLCLWSGACNPTDRALELVRRDDQLELNGGDPRMDGSYPSISHLAPLHRPVGGFHQTYTSGPNDFLMTDRWALPRATFLNVLETFESSGSPRRLIPVNLYIHFYLLSELAGARALDAVLDWIEARRNDLHLVWASEYVTTAAGFRSARVERLEGGGWRVRDHGRCMTVRFDRPDFREVDLARSRGVMGYAAGTDCLYVHLDESGDSVVVPGPPDGERGERDFDPAGGPWLRSSTATVSELSVRDGGLSFRAWGYGPVRIRLAGLEPAATYRLLGRPDAPGGPTPGGRGDASPGERVDPDPGGARGTGPARLRADAAGNLEIDLELRGATPLILIREEAS